MEAFARMLVVSETYKMIRMIDKNVILSDQQTDFGRGGGECFGSVSESVD